MWKYNLIKTVRLYQTKQEVSDICQPAFEFNAVQERKKNNCWDKYAKKLKAQWETFSVVFWHVTEGPNVCSNVSEVARKKKNISCSQQPRTWICSGSRDFTLTSKLVQEGHHSKIVGFERIVLSSETA